MSLLMKGRYYAIYKPRDAYPQGLGQDLVDRIPKERKRYAGKIQLKTSVEKHHWII